MNYKKFCWAFLLSLILINTGLVMPSYANTRELRTITVTGEGIENIATSKAIVRLGVEVQGKEAGKVQRETASRSDAVVKFLRSRQVEKLETTGISLQPNYDYSNNQRRLIGYIGANLISFQIDIAQAGILIDEAVKVGQHASMGSVLLPENQRSQLPKELLSSKPRNKLENRRQSCYKPSV